jgi:hypothetical protein
MPMSTTATSPACSAPGEITHPAFAAWAHTVTSARTAAPRHLARRAVHARGHVHRDHRGLAGVHLLYELRHVLANLAGEPRTEQRIHDEVRFAQLLLKPIALGEAHVQVLEDLQVRPRVARESVFGGEHGDFRSGAT